MQLIVQDKLSGAWGEPNGWRVVMGLEAVPGLVMLLGALKCVESPHWLLRRGMSVEAERVLRRIYQPVRNRDGTCDCEEKNGDMTDALDTLARGLEARFFKARGGGAGAERSAERRAALSPLLPPLARLPSSHSQTHSHTRPTPPHRGPTGSAAPSSP